MENNRSIQVIASDLYNCLARRFPVCCFSDEFYYFPQALSAETDWTAWDDLSPEGVRDALSVLRKFRLDLEGLQGSGWEDDGDRRTRRLLSRHVDVLMEQLEDMKLFSSKPTFILTVASAGLLQALQSQDEHALGARLSALPGFLQGAFESLDKVPVLFRDLGLEMAEDIRKWIATLGDVRPMSQAAESVDLFSKKLARIPTTDRFQLDPDQLERIVCHHSGSGFTVAEALAELEDEERETGSLLARESRNLAGSEDFNELFGALKPDPLPEGGPIRLLFLETARLKEHCADLGIREASRAPDVDIRRLPHSLAAIRAADSYNARPGNPSGGGTFYIFAGGTLGRSALSVHPSYRMTVAHETYPGHHLLDTCRWNHPDPVRRPLEYPLFYEGWACFGEDLMLQSGAFDRAYDRFLVTWRRYRHAVRGRTDLLLHSGRVDLETAAVHLSQAGLTRVRAIETVRKYALQPAYQMCYSIGRRGFQSLFRSTGGEGVPNFINAVLSEGELLFQDLEHVLKQKLST
ncbi:MAG: DUF885 family protein [bacterium]|nr:DUF885 family protein [bacterium]